VIDAFGKPGTGLMDYNLNMMGNYDECIAIQADRYTDPEKKQGLDHPYTGKYCTGNVQLTSEVCPSVFCCCCYFLFLFYSLDCVGAVFCEPRLCSLFLNSYNLATPLW
jgi:hypothetical protein